MENKVLDKYAAWSLAVKHKCLFIPEGIVTIGQDAFRRRHGIDSIVFPNSLTTIFANAFAETNLKKVTIPPRLEYMSIAPFCFCKQLEEFDVSPQNAHYKSVDGVLYDYNLTTLVHYPAGKKEDTFIFPDTIRHIAPKAFAGCQYLKKVILPIEIKKITSRAFQSCYSLEEIILPQNLETINESAFAYCQSLRDISIPPLCFVEKVAFLGCDAVSPFQMPAEIPVKYKFKIKQCEKETGFVANQIFLPTNDEFTRILKTEELRTFSTFCEETRAGKQIIGSQFDFAPSSNTHNLDNNGIVRVGTYVTYGDVLVKKATPKHEWELSEQESLLRAIFGEKGPEYKDSSLIVPFHVQGVVTEIMVNRKPYVNDAAVQVDMVAVTIMQSFPIGIGDVLSDEDGNKGIVVGFDASLPSDTIRTNFHIDNVLNKTLVAQKEMCARSIGKYSVWEYPISTRYQCGDISYIISDVPQCVGKKDIFRFFSHGYGDILQNILLFQGCEAENRSEVRRNKNGVSNYHLPKSSINTFIGLLRSSCIKPVFYDEKGQELQFSYTQNNIEFVKALQGEITLKLECLSDEDIYQMSHGEVTNASPPSHAYEPNGLFCQKIFGPILDFRCRCGRYYRRAKSLGTICERCGVEFSKSNIRNERMGHINLADAIPHPFSSKRTISALPVLPTELRPIIASDLNDHYRKVVDRNNCVKRLRELGASGIVFENEQRMALKNARALIHNKGGLIDNLGDALKDVFGDRPLDFSASCAITIDNSLNKSSCGLPIKLAIELFKPFIIRSLYREQIVGNIEDAKKYLKEMLHRRSEDLSKSIAILNEILSKYKIIIYAKESAGKILFVTPIITVSCALSVTNEQFFALSLGEGEKATIILPITNTAQKMIFDILENGTPPQYDIENEEQVDLIKELYKASMSNESLSVVLRKVIDNHCICRFETIFSKMLIGKPSPWAWKFYDVPSEEYANIDETIEDEFSE